MRERLYRAILAARRDDAIMILRTASAEFGYRSIIAEVLEPTLRLIGERWNADSISLAQAYVAGKVAEDLLPFVVDDEESRAGGTIVSRGTAVICNAEDDYHGLGRRMVGIFLRISGWKIVDLGNDALAPLVVEEALRCHADIVGVSAMMLTNAKNIAKVRDEIDRRGLGSSLKLAVGGAVFVMRPELVAEVGGDGTAQTAMDAPELFSRLIAETAASGTRAGVVA